MTRRGRIEGLNAWRAVLLVGGLLFHGTVLKEQSPFFDLVQLVSASFRMGAFFAIAGMLAALTLSRRSALGWLAGRTTRIGIPAIFGLLVICPVITLLLRAGLGPERADRVLLFEWHHLWFLFALLAYQAIAYAIHVRMSRRMAVRLLRRMRAMGQAGVLAFTAVISLALMVAAMRLVLPYAPEAYRPMLSEFRMIAGHVPLYLLGLALGHSRALRMAMLSQIRVPAALLLAASGGYLLWYNVGAALVPPAEYAVWDQILRFVGSAVCPPAATVLILRSALRIRFVSAYVHRLCEASFTIYLVHYPLVLAANLLAMRVLWEPHFEYALAIVFAGIASYAFHFGVVRRWPVLRLLFNGERDRRAPAAGPLAKPA